MNDLRLEDRVEFTGAIDQDRLLELYSKAALLVLTSEEETAPMVISQALACGLVVVATDVGGVRWMIDDGENGYIVAQEDIQKLALAISKILLKDINIDKMSQSGKNIAYKKYHPDRVAGKTVDLYMRLIHGF